MLKNLPPSPAIIEGPLPEAPGLIALNALYFKGLWSRPFVKDLTRLMPFQNAAGIKSQVAMMKARGEMSFRADGRFVAVDLPYRDKRFSMVLVTANDRPARAAEFAKIEGWLDGGGFADADVDLSLPRFTTQDGRDLLPALDDMGLGNGRKSPTAFQKLSPRPLEISTIAQQTFLRLDEEGSEAAAATATSMKLSSVQSDERIMVVDKPFVFALRDRSLGLILLSGYVGRPTTEVALSKKAR